MEKVLMSVGFEGFKATKFTTMDEAIKHVKESNLKNVQLKLKTTEKTTTWDNF